VVLRAFAAAGAA